ncbi:MAG: abortive infection family protein [Leptolyngbya sp. SIOISBB]|nr:abortive infection family protein [Leptolyngbya sp. SIOISBB]
MTGDEGISTYRSGPDLVRLFNDYGSNDEYGQGFPSRWQYAEQKLRELNGTPALAALLREVLDPREFMDTEHELGPALEYINKRLSYDGFEIVLEGGLAKVLNQQGVHVEARHPFEGSKEQAHIFINEQVEKSERKIQDEDYDGAITNARSLVEAVLTQIESDLNPEPPKYDGDLPKLYKRVQKLLHLDPGRPDINQSLKQVLSGLVNIIQGLSGLSNKMGDRHVRTYKPSRHHAILVCNSAKSVCNFLFDTYAYQREKATR